MTDAKPYRLTTSGAEFDQAMTPEQWEACGRHIVRLHTGTCWALGDWLVYGLGRGPWGMSYDRAVDITGKSHDSLAQYYATSRAFLRHQRTVPLAWSWYRQARMLPEGERVEALVRAHEQHWKRRDWEEYITIRNGELVGEFTNRAEPPARVAPEIARKLNWARKRQAKRDARAGQRQEHMYCPSCGHRIQQWIPCDGERKPGQRGAAKSWVA